jgi:hypothetical protein
MSCLVSFKTLHMRWWAGIVYFVALFPIFCLYFIWLPLTCWGWIKVAGIPPSNMLLVPECNDDNSKLTVLSTPGEEQLVAEDQQLIIPVSYDSMVHSVGRSCQLLSIMFSLFTYII